jgi:hypothetical protein
MIRGIATGLSSDNEVSSSLCWLYALPAVLFNVFVYGSTGIPGQFGVHLSESLFAMIEGGCRPCSLITMIFPAF